MTVSTSANRADYIGNNVTTAFAVPFYFPDPTNLQVLSTVLATGVSTPLVLNSDYTVSGAGVSTGGTVTMSVAPAPAVKITILLNLAFVQNTHYVPNDPFPAASHEAALDYLTLLDKQCEEQVSRALQVPAGENGTTVVLPAAPSRANLLLGFDSSGNPVAVAPTNGSSVALALQLANAASPTQGAGQTGYGGDQNYVGKTIGARLLDVGASPRSLGGTGDGVADDTAFITACLIYSKTLDLSNRSWKISSTITLPAGTTINMRSANIVAACGSTPIFQFLNGNVGLYIQHGGGIVSGTASCFLFAQGKTNQPAGQSDFATQIHLESVMISSATITTSLLFDKAVKSVYLHGVNFFTPNGIGASGACVEVMISDSIIYGATGGSFPQTVGLTLSAATSGAGRTATAASATFTASDVGRNLSAGTGFAQITGYTSPTVVTVTITSDFAGTSLISGGWSLGTFGVKLRSTGGTIYYNQGWSVVNSTIDNFEISNDVSDCFVYTVTGGYTACNATVAATTGYAFQFQAPLNTNLTDTITIGGAAVIGGRIRFASSTGGQAYNANIDATFSGVPGTAISFENNASNVRWKGKFKAGTNTPVVAAGVNNNANIICDGVDADSTYTGGVIMNGANGAGCSISNITYAGTGDPFFVARPMRIKNVPVQTAAGIGAKQQFNPADLAGTYAVGSAISSQAITFAKGETGWIVASLPCSGMNAGTQRFDLAFPAGMNVPGGTGWGATFNYPSAASALVAIRVPYYCTADGSGTLSITNAVGNTVTLNSHGYFGIERAF